MSPPCAIAISVVFLVLANSATRTAAASIQSRHVENDAHGKDISSMVKPVVAQVDTIDDSSPGAPSLDLTLSLPDDVIGAIVAMVENDPEEARKMLEEVRNTIDDFIDKYRRRLLKAHIPDWENWSNRTKRYATDQVDPVYVDPPNGAVQILKGVVGKFCIPVANPLNMEIFSAFGSIYALAATGTMQPNAFLFQLGTSDSAGGDVGKSIEIFRPVAIVGDGFPTPNTVELRHLEIGGNHFIIAVEYTDCRIQQQKQEGNDVGYEGTAVFKLEANNTLIYVQSLPECFPTSMTTWRMDELVCVAFSSEKAIMPETQVPVYQTTSNVYCWMGYHFDKVTHVPTSGAAGMVAFSIMGKTFLVVANGRDNVGEVNIESESWEWDMNENKFVPFQRFQTQAAADVAFLTIPGEGAVNDHHFLIFSNGYTLDSSGNKKYETSKLAIYKYESDYFVPFQCIGTHGGGKIVALSSEGRVLLCHATVSDGLSCWQYDGWRFSTVPNLKLTTGNLAPGLNDVTTALIDKTLYFVAANQKSDMSSDSMCYSYPNVFELDFEAENYVEDYYKEANDWCRRAVNEVAAIDVAAMLDSLEKAPKLTDDVLYLKGPVVFEKNLDVIGTLRTNSLEKKDPDDQIDPTNFRDLLGNLQATLDRINPLFQEVARFQMAIKEADASGPPADITAAYVDCTSQDCSKISNFTANYIGGVPTETLRDGVVCMSDDAGSAQNKVMKLSFEHVVIPEGGEIIVKNLNGENADDLLRKDADEKILASMTTFEDVIFNSDVTVMGLVDGVYMQRDHVCLTDADNKFTGQVTTSSVTANSVQIGNFDGRNLSHYLYDALMTRPYDTQPQVVKTPIVFDSEDPAQTILRIDGNLEATSVCGVDIAKLVKESVKRKTEDGTIQVVNGDVYVDYLKVVGDLHVKDHVQTPGSYGAPEPENLVYKGDLHLQDLTVTDGVQVSVLNGIDSDPESGYLNVMATFWPTSAPGVTTPLVFPDAVFRNDVLMEDGKTTNGVDLSELMKDHETGKQIIASVVVKGNLNSHGNILLGDKATTNFNPKETIESCWRTDDPDPPTFKTVTFKNSATVDNLRAAEVNTIKTRDLVRLGEPHDITAEKIFLHPITCDDDVPVSGYVNGRLPDVYCNQYWLTTDGDQTCNGTITFLGGLKAESFEAESIFINGIKVDTDTMTIPGKRVPGTTYVEGGAIFKSGFTTSHLKVISGTLNGIEPEEICTNTLLTSIDAIQEVTGHKVFLPPVHFDVLDSPSLAEVLSRICRQVDPECRVSSLVFDSNVVADDCVVTHSLDGVEFPDGGWPNWLLSEGDQHGSGTIVFEAGLEAPAGMYVTSGKVNDYPLQTLNRTININAEKCVLPMDTSFTGTVESVGGLNVASLNGLNVQEDLLTTDLPEWNIKSEVVFKGGLVINGDTRIHGKVIRYTVDEICSWDRYHVGASSGDIFVAGHATFTQDVYANYLNDFDTSNFGNLWLSHKPATFTALASFQNLQCGSMRVENGEINGINIDSLANSFIELEKAFKQTTTTPAKFDVLVVKSDFLGNITLLGSFNGWDTEKIGEHCLRLNGPAQTAKAPMKFNECYFHSDLTTPSINGINPETDLIILGRDNEISCPNLKINSALANDLNLTEPYGVINGTNITDWMESSASTSVPPEEPFRDTTFRKLVVLGPGLHLESINGGPINSKSVLLKSGDQELRGNLVLKSPSTIKNLNASSLNGQDLESLPYVRRSDEDIRFKDQGMTLNDPFEVSKLEMGLLDSNLGHMPDYFSDVEKQVRQLRSLADSLNIRNYLNQSIVFDYYRSKPMFKAGEAVALDYLGDNLVGLSVHPKKPDWSDITSYRVFAKEGETFTFKFEVSALGAKKGLIITSPANEAKYLVVTSSGVGEPNPITTPSIYGNRLYLLNGQMDSSTLVQEMPSRHTTDAVQMTVGQEVFVCFVYLGSHEDSNAEAEVWRLNSAKAQLELWQKLPGHGSIAAASLNSAISKTPIFLICNSRDSQKPPTEVVYSQLYTISEGGEIKLLQEFGFPSCRTARLASLEKKEFLAFGVGSSGYEKTRNSLHFFQRTDLGKGQDTADEETFLKIQEEPLPAPPLDIVFPVLPTGELYCIVALDSNKDNIQLWKYHHAAGFVLKGTMTKPGISAISETDFGTKNEHFLLLAGVSPSYIRAYSEPSGNPSSSIYSAVFVGREY